MDKGRALELWKSRNYRVSGRAKLRMLEEGADAEVKLKFSVQNELLIITLGET
ncbi:MAG: hypothetical protein QMC78_04460 [Methanocellales archaeon]|nr:hypothetical protein [Methanocellales archaeon]